MSLGVEVGDLLASAERRDKGGMARFTGKRRGEMAEAAFVAKAVSLGFGVAKPWGDSDRLILSCRRAGGCRRCR